MTWTSVHEGHGRCFIGKAPEFFSSHTKLASLLRAIVSVAVHGTDPLAQRLSRLSRAARHRSVWTYFVFQCAGRNFYKLVHGERTHQFGQTLNSAVFRHQKSQVVELPNSEVFVLFPRLASVCYNVWNIECLENLWGEYVRKWLNLLKIDDNSWQSKKNRAVVSIRVPKGKRVRKLPNSEVQRPQDFRYRKTAEFGVCPNWHEPS